MKLILGRDIGWEVKVCNVIHRPRSSILGIFDHLYIYIILYLQASITIYYRRSKNTVSMEHRTKCID